MITFREWAFVKTIQLLTEMEIDQTFVNLFHGTLLKDAENIMRNGIQSQMRSYGVGEFWATTDIQKAKMYAQVHDSVEDYNNPPPLGVYAFSLPNRILQEMLEYGLAQEEEQGVYQFFGNSFEQLNIYSQKKGIIPIEKHELMGS